MRWKFAGVLALAVTVLTPVAWASASDAVLVTEPLIVEVGEDSIATGTLTFLNTSSGSLTLRLDGPTASGCTVEPATSELAGARQHEVEVTLTGCHPDDGSGFTLQASIPGQTWDIVATVAPGADPDWDRMIWFVIAAIIAALVAVIVFSRWDGADGSVTNEARATAAAAGKPIPGRSLRTPLPGLGSKYDFSKSWASNVTIISGAFAAVFGSSEVLKALLGAEDESVLAVVVVAAAIAIGLVTAGPLIVLATRAGKHPSAGGLLLGAVFTLGAAGGQLGVLVETGSSLDLGRVDEAVLVLGVLGGLLLLVYAFRSLLTALTDGFTEPDPDVEVATQTDALDAEYLAQVVGAIGPDQRIHLVTPAPTFVRARLRSADRPSAVL